MTEELCIYGDLLTLLGTREDKDYLQKLDNLDQVEERGVGCGGDKWGAWGCGVAKCRRCRSLVGVWRSEMMEVLKLGGGEAQ